MPVPLWPSDWLEGSIHSRSVQVWRGVEAQHVVSTMKLADTKEEQSLLEALLETSKPPLPTAAQGKHYLLSTPFRYSPTYESRFRPAGARGQWYGANTAYGVCAELAYYQHRFLSESEGITDGALLTRHSLFRADIQGRALDLTVAPWVQAREQWVHPSDYTATQSLAASAQQKGVQWVRYESARAQGEYCAVVFDPSALSEPSPSLDSTLQTWDCKTTRHYVTFQRHGERFSWQF